MSVIADLEPLVAPVDPAAPAGLDLRYQPIFDEIKAARREAEEDPRELAPWKRVADLVVSAMARSRDLQLVAWLTETLVRIDGFQGAASGLAITRRTLDQYWDALYPRIDPEDSDPLEHRRALLEWLDDRLPDIVKIAPLTGPPSLFGVVHYEVTQKTGPEKQALIDEGWPTIDRFQSALQATAPARLDTVLAHILACDAELTALQASVDTHFKQGGGLSFGNLRRAFDTARWLVERVVKKNAPETAPASGDGGGAAGPPQAVSIADTNGDQLWSEALTLTRDSKVDGLRMVQTHLSGATSGRDTFLRQLQLAELSLEAGVYSLAFPVFDDLVRIIDTRKLEEWEDKRLIVRVMRGLARSAGLLRALNSAAASREAEMVDRIARLDGTPPDAAL